MLPSAHIFFVFNSLYIEKKKDFWFQMVKHWNLFQDII